MGELAATLSDYVVLTSDNPRFEDPMEIMLEIASGVSKLSEKYTLIENRKEAIRYAIEKMRTGDTVVIAGKGGEKYTDIRGKKFKSDDLSDVKDCIKGLYVDIIS
jgi:UDP-N-acetylmuramoyl-L-alanyl-D-glutamate--2,6-diaminopimelate ligase